jgi:hypothetical protein
LADFGVEVVAVDNHMEPAAAATGLASAPATAVARAVQVSAPQAELLHHLTHGSVPFTFGTDAFEITVPPSGAGPPDRGGSVRRLVVAVFVITRHGLDDADDAADEGPCAERVTHFDASWSGTAVQPHGWSAIHRLPAAVPRPATYRQPGFAEGFATYPMAILMPPPSEYPDANHSLPHLGQKSTNMGESSSKTG